MSVCWRAFILVLLGLVTAFQITAAEAQADVQRMVIEEAMSSRVPPALALAVARAESNFEPRAQSPVGARGVMQIMPKTARGVFGVHESQLWNARLNIQLGLKFLEQLYDQYGQRWDLALSHYNGGTVMGSAPHDFTRKYIADVQRWQRYYENPAAFRTEVDRVRTQVRPTRPAATARPWQRFDPLEYDEWAETEQRRIERRRELDDFARRR